MAAQAWQSGLKRFLSNVPEQTPDNAAALEELKQRFEAENITMVRVVFTEPSQGLLLGILQ